MGRYIDADEFKKVVIECSKPLNKLEMAKALCVLIDTQPAVYVFPESDPEKRKAWRIETYKDYTEAFCPTCDRRAREDGASKPIMTKFCPHCGEKLIYEKHEPNFESFKQALNKEQAMTKEQIQAIKQFAERLKEKARSGAPHLHVVSPIGIDELVEEMTKQKERND